jgi:cellulose synthase/poly-beta-1,6-N-acetylglucosamine synthase-like glycosyltransferase
VLAASAIFWVSLFAMAYAYVGYPAVLWILSRVARRRIAEYPGHERDLPSVTMIVSAYNEEAVIGGKIENALSMDYPRELLEIVVVSDGSTDRTCEISSQNAHRGVVLRHYTGRIGKTACLNQAVPLAAGAVVVFSDANSTFDRGALQALVQPFVDPGVGFTTGWTLYGATGEAAPGSLGLYSKLELKTKELESLLGSCIGADGAIFAIRKELYPTLRDYDINDFVIPLSINERGYRGVLQRGAICVEKDAGSAQAEFRRQVRISNRTIRAILNYRHLMNPFRFGFLSFELFSHKVCRFLVPLLMLAILLSNVVLARETGFFLLVLFLQVSFYFAAGAATFVSEGGLLSRLTEAARTLVAVNAAIAWAWIKYFQGETFTTWSPTKR